MEFQNYRFYERLWGDEDLHLDQYLDYTGTKENAIYRLGNKWITVDLTYCDIQDVADTLMEIED